MEVVEKEKETIKEVPAGYYHDKYGCYEGRYGTAPFASKSVAGTGLGLGIAGTALGDILIGGGRIEMGIPFTDKSIVLSERDLVELREILTSKQ